MLDGVLADLTAPGAAEAFQRAQETGLRAYCELGAVIREWHRLLLDRVAEWGAELAHAKARLPAEQWPRWLAAEFSCSPALAAEFIQAHEDPASAPAVVERLAELMLQAVAPMNDLAGLAAAGRLHLGVGSVFSGFSTS